MRLPDSGECMSAQMPDDGALVKVGSGGAQFFERGLELASKVRDRDIPVSPQDTDRFCNLRQNYKRSLNEKLKLTEIDIWSRVSTLASGTQTSLPEYTPHTTRDESHELDCGVGVFCADSIEKRCGYSDEFRISNGVDSIRPSDRGDHVKLADRIVLPVFPEYFNRLSFL